MTATLHFSEFSTLAACERKWGYRYGLGSDEKVGDGAHLGTLLHVGTELWLSRSGIALPRTWQAASHSDDASPGDTVTYNLSDFDPELVAKAEWLLARYASYYGSEPPSSWNVISTELWLTAQTQWGTLAGTADGVVEIDGQLYLIERKSYGSKGRLNWVHVDPQLGVYDLLVEATFGKPAFGILFDGIYTYRWVPKKRTLAVIEHEIGTFGAGAVDTYPTKAEIKARAKEIQASEPGLEREPGESFQREWVDLSDQHRASTSNYLAAAVERRAVLAREGGTPSQQATLLDRTIPNIGRQCDYCDFKPRCWNDLGGVEVDDIEVDDSDEEPV